jgi:hypothetical protein
MKKKRRKRAEMLKKEARTKQKQKLLKHTKRVVFLCAQPMRTLRLQISDV